VNFRAWRKQVLETKAQGLARTEYEAALQVDDAEASKLLRAVPLTLYGHLFAASEEHLQMDYRGIPSMLVPSRDCAGFEDKFAIYCVYEAGGPFAARKAEGSGPFGPSARNRG
jgi:hypothetical protein